ncbi:MAG: APC family permease [Erysipelotrichaceae bacterium]
MSTIPKKKFSLLTTVSMIIGIVIGSGIFFKTNSIIIAVEGNILLGILVFVIGAFGIIFGGLTLSTYAKNNDKAGGLISYCEDALGNRFGYMVGIFQTYIYFPIITCILTWVCANYLLTLFGQNSLLGNGQNNLLVYPLTVVLLVIFFVVNTIQTANAGHFQKISMFAKVFALLTLSVCGLFFGNPVSNIATSSSYSAPVVGIFLAIVSVAFSFDGWSIAPSISHEVVDGKKNMSLALTIAPIIITIIYIAYFVGLCSFTSFDQIQIGVDPLNNLASSLFGPIGMKIVYTFVVISVFGGVNGVILGYIRLPYSLALRGNINNSDKLKTLHPKYDTPVNSAILAFVFALIWLFIHFLTIDGSLINITFLSGLGIDNLAIVLMTVVYFVLYIGAMRNKESSTLYRYVFPTLAMIGAGIIIYGGLSQPVFNLYLIGGMVIMVLIYLLNKK